MTTGSIGPGTVIADRYRLEDLLAESAGARFWRATDTVLSRSVAIHAVTSDDPRSPGLLEAARVSATVTDPHLLRVLDCDDSGGITWVVNEWGDGVSLDLMLQQGTLPPSRAAWLTREVADTIAAGHAVGVPHGRLNPEAVLVTHAGAVKLIGFVVDASLEPPRPPDPAYGDIDDRESDVINLAGILYAALTGRWPGVARSAVPKAPREGGRPLRPRQVRAGVPRTLDTICDRVLSQEASQHAMPIETALEVAAALADYVGEPGQLAPLEPTAMHHEPTVSIPRGAIPSSIPEPETDPASGTASVEADALEDTQLSMAVPDSPTARADDPESTQLHREPLESPESLTPLRAPVVEAQPPPPPFEDLPERPLFADTERRVPRSAAAADTGAGAGMGTGIGTGIGAVVSAPGTWADTSEGALEPGTSPGTDTGGFWPFVDGDDHRNDVHTGREGRGWLRIGLIAGLLLAVLVAMFFAFDQGREDGTGDPATGDGANEPSASAGGARLAVTEAQDFDPLGDGSENSDTAELVIDNDPASGWRTVTYFNNPALGGLKPGVGVLLDLGRDRGPGSVDILFRGQPTDLEVYAASEGVTEPPDSLEQLSKVGEKDGASDNTTVRLEDDTQTRYLVVWLTRLPPVSGGFRGEITDVTVRS